ncbi:hypothetical protein A9Q99_12925 [Gammaproteobacteria bacterium 45_16_T64]|nr:hypothetical protein A9Q99_12925 [Gammaproteobacteria bacterium 45_16_T64]
MKPRNNKERRMLECCAELRVDDGISPRHQKKETQQSIEHKLERLCSQVQKAIRFAIAEYCANTPLSQWDADSVEQEKQGPRFIVTLIQVTGEKPTNDSIELLLKEYKGVIRKAVSESITRKKTPPLRFQIIEGGLNE